MVKRNHQLKINKGIIVAMKKPVAKAVKKHLKEDSKDCKKETKEHNALIKKINKAKKPAKKK